MDSASVIIWRELLVPPVDPLTLRQAQIIVGFDRDHVKLFALSQVQAADRRLALLQKLNLPSADPLIGNLANLRYCWELKWNRMQQEDFPSAPLALQSLPGTATDTLTLGQQYVVPKPRTESSYELLVKKQMKWLKENQDNLDRYNREAEGR